MVTASADKLIKLWKAGVNTHTLSGHTDAVRSLAVISSEEFLSASNDATVRRWSRTGDCLGTFYGHENYIYSVALFPSSPTQVETKLAVDRDKSMNILLHVFLLTIYVYGDKNYFDKFHVHQCQAQIEI